MFLQKQQQLLTTLFPLLLGSFLAPGVGAIGPIELDHFPYAFRRDLLAHEAHRHPYIELFGQLCLLKIRCGKAFGSRAHASWRLLFVVTLMPWLKQYRVRGTMNGDERSDRPGQEDAAHRLRYEQCEI